MKQAIRLLSLLLLLCLLNSCVEQQEGCLDPLADNYSIFADKECKDSCCVYPNLTITTKYLKDSINIDSALYYENDLASYFKLRAFYLVFSNFELTGEKDVYRSISELPLGGSVIDDLLYMKYRSGSSTIGAIKIEDSLTLVNFDIGFSEELDIPTDPNLNYDLIELLQDSMYYSDNLSAYYKMRIEIEIDSNTQEMLTLQFPDLQYFLEKPLESDISRGTDVNIQLSVDFSRLFSGIDFQSDNVEETISDIIIENLIESIDVE